LSELHINRRLLKQRCDPTTLHFDAFSSSALVLESPPLSSVSWSRYFCAHFPVHRVGTSGRNENWFIASVDDAPSNKTKNGVSIGPHPRLDNPSS